MSLSDSLSISESSFRQSLTDLTLYPSPLTENIVNTTLKSNPNFNYLYSNYTPEASEPFSVFSLLISQLGPSSSLINIFYGPDLDVIF